MLQAWSDAQLRVVRLKYLGTSGTPHFPGTAVRAVREGIVIVTYHADQKPVVREKLEPRRLDVRLKLVQLNAVAVIDEHILLLRYRKM